MLGLVLRSFFPRNSRPVAKSSHHLHIAPRLTEGRFAIIKIPRESKQGHEHNLNSSRKLSPSLYYSQPANLLTHLPSHLMTKRKQYRSLLKLGP